MYQFIINPNAQGGKGIKIWRQLERQLKRMCVEYHAYLTEQAGDARSIASELTRKSQAECCLVVVGGDGTLSEVLDGLSFSPGLMIGYIPIGFTNDFARSIRLPRHPRACLKRIMRPRQIKMVDYGVVTYDTDTVKHRRFLVGAGIGLYSGFCQHVCSQKTERRLRRFHVKWICNLMMNLKQIAEFTPVRGYLLLDGVKKVEFSRLYLVSANVQPYIGGGFKLAPKANSSDGKLSLCVVHSTTKIHLIPVGLRAKLGSLGRDRGVRFYDCREAVVHLEQPCPLHVDGEICQPQTDLHIRCIEKKLRVIR